MIKENPLRSADGQVYVKKTLDELEKKYLKFQKEGGYNRKV